LGNQRNPRLAVYDLLYLENLEHRGLYIGISRYLIQSFPDNTWPHGGSFGNSASQAEKRYGPPPAKKDQRPSYVPPKPYMKTIEHNPSPDFAASDTSALQAGQKVEHQKFGFGEVIGVEGSAHNPVATVRFQYNGDKKIMLNYAKLRIIDDQSGSSTS